MPACPKFILTFIGIILNGFGLACGVKAFINTQRSYGDGPLFPTATKIYSAFKNIACRLLFFLRKKRDQVVYEEDIETVVAIGINMRTVTRVGFPENISDPESIARLIRAVIGIYEELDRDYKSLNEQLSETANKLSILSQVVDEKNKMQEEFSRKAVSGEVPLQLRSLLFIGSGTILMAIPTLWESILLLL